MIQEAGLFDWSDCDQIFKDLFEKGLKPIVVGGQAVNFWVYYYAQTYSDFSAPVASKDIDVLGDVLLARRCADALGARCNVIDRAKHAVPMNAIVILGKDENALKIDFQSGSEPNLVAEIKRDAVPLSTTWGEVLVMHPLHCLKSRVFNVLRIWSGAEKKYDNDRGLAQLRAAMAIVRCFANDRLQTEGGQQKVLNLYEGLFQFARTELGARLWHGKQIEVFSCVQPLDGLPEGFLKKRYPQMKQAVDKARGTTR